MAEKPTPPWAAEIPEGAFISSAPTYPLGRYLERFRKDYFTASDGTKLKYYFFDPTEYGWPAKKDYPILIFFHGTSNSFVDDVCVNYTGAEMYASDEYQKAMGGAYILVPVANEYRDENGRVQGYWSAPYIESAHELVTSVIATRTNGVGTRFSFGNSSGARFVFRLADAHPEGYDVFPECEEIARKNAKKSGGSFTKVNSMAEAFKDADIVYPKSWAPFAAMEKRTDLYGKGDFDGIDALEKELLAQNAQHKDWTCSEELMKTTRDGKALYLHCLPADITGVSCEAGEVDASVFERYIDPLYKEASYKPYVIAAMIFLAKCRNPQETLKKIAERNRPRLFQ
jgi:hypothetical protein